MDDEQEDKTGRRRLAQVKPKKLELSERGTRFFAQPKIELTSNCCSEKQIEDDQARE